MRSKRKRRKRNHGRSFVQTVILVCIIGAIVALIGGGAWLTYREMTKVPEDTTIPGQMANEKQKWPLADKLAGSPYSTKYDGIDISKHQGRIRWDALATKNKKISFMFIRAMDSKGRYDKVYRSQVEEARKRGIPVGSYIFFTMRMSAREQFEKFRILVEKDKQDLLPVIDVEDKSLIGGDVADLKDSVMVMAKLMEKEYGKKPIIYSNEHHYQMYLAPEFNSYPLWIANYTREPKISGARPLVWQYSDKGHLHGIWTYIDLDRFINGATIDDLRR